MRVRPKELILAQFLEGINQAAGSARHLLHHQQNHNWFDIVAILEAVHRMIVSQAVDPMLKPKPKLVKE